MATPKEDSEKLMSELFPFAQKMLNEHGEFYPYGGAMEPDGKIVQQAAYTGTEHPNSSELIELMIQTFQKGATNGKFIATGLVYDIYTTPPGQTEKTDAICVSLDHKDNYSVNVIFPYKRTDTGAIVISQPYATKGKGQIFSSK